MTGWLTGWLVSYLVGLLACQSDVFDRSPVIIMPVIIYIFFCCAFYLKIGLCVGYAFPHFQKNETKRNENFLPPTLETQDNPLESIKNLHIFITFYLTANAE